MSNGVNRKRARVCLSSHQYSGDKAVTAPLFISPIFSYIVNRVRLYSCANCWCFPEGRRLGGPRHSGSGGGGSGRKRGGSSVQRRPRHEAPGPGRTGGPDSSYCDYPVV